MTITTRQGLTYGSACIALGILIGSYVGCRLAANPVVHTATNTVEKRVPVHDTTISTKYIAGRSQFVHDTTKEYAPIPGQFRVDTLIVTHMVLVHDTVITDSQVAKTTIAGVLAAFQSGRHQSILEVDVAAEHDFIFGGYGGNIAAILNGEALGIANIAVYIAVGYLHAMFATFGLSGKIWGTG